MKYPSNEKDLLFEFVRSVFNVLKYSGLTLVVFISFYLMILGFLDIKPELGDPYTFDKWRNTCIQGKYIGFGQNEKLVLKCIKFGTSERERTIEYDQYGIPHYGEVVFIK